MTQIFVDRTDAGDRLAEALDGYRDVAPVVLGLPRGGVPVARRVADRLAAPLDVLGVRKLASPRHPEFAVGAIGEDGVRVVDETSVRRMALTDADLAKVEEAERSELNRRLALYRRGRQRLDLRGRVVIVVDDGIATGATARAACEVARGIGAAEVVLSAPVAPAGEIDALGRAADATVIVSSPSVFRAVGQWYVHFDQTTDAEVVACLDR